MSTSPRRDPRQKITRKEAIEAYEASGRVVAQAAKKLGVHPNTLRAVLMLAGVAHAEQMSEANIPSQYLPDYENCRARVGRREALRIIRDHIERRG